MYPAVHCILYCSHHTLLALGEPLSCPTAYKIELQPHHCLQVPPWTVTTMKNPRQMEASPHPRPQRSCIDLPIASISSPSPTTMPQHRRANPHWSSMIASGRPTCSASRILYSNAAQTQSSGCCASSRPETYEDGFGISSLQSVQAIKTKS